MGMYRDIQGSARMRVGICRDKLRYVGICWIPRDIYGLVITPRAQEPSVKDCTLSDT